jgi:hypothetical protein
MRKEELKEGDMLWMRDNWIFIYDSLAPTPVLGHNDVIIYKAVIHLREDGRIGHYVSIPPQPSRGIGYFSDARNLRLATNYEKETFYDELRIRGFVYNEETKRVEKIQ